MTCSRTRNDNPERDAAIVAMDRTGAPRREIAARFGMSTQRVAQILGMEKRRMERPEAPPMTGAEVEAFLDAAVARECAPPWERHPIPTT